MRRPEVVLLSQGDILFRFASTTRLQNGQQVATDSSKWANGAWWVSESDYRKIIQRFSQSKLNLGIVARSALAVQPSWSMVDVSIKAYLLNDMNVYAGSGSTQYRDVLPNGMSITLPGWSDITQIYIPGMRGAARSNIKVMRQKIVKSHAWGF